MLVAVVAPIVQIPFPAACLAAFGSLVATYDLLAAVFADVHGNLLIASLRID